MLHCYGPAYESCTIKDAMIVIALKVQLAISESVPRLIIYMYNFKNTVKL